MNSNWVNKANEKAYKYMESRKKAGKCCNITNLRENIGDRRIAAGKSGDPFKIKYSDPNNFENFKKILKDYSKDAELAHNMLFKMRVLELYYQRPKVRGIINYISEFQRCKGTSKDDVIFLDELGNPINLKLFSKLRSKSALNNKSYFNIPVYYKLARG